MAEQNYKNNMKNKNSAAQSGGKNKFSLLTYVLIICIIELTFGAIQNINKNINFSAKIKGLENKRNEEMGRNLQLKSEIENFNSDVILESIARNNLKMAGEDEVLIIINKPEETQQNELVNAVHKKKNKNIKNDINNVKPAH